MLITEREAEAICCALMALKTPEGLVTMWGSRVAMEVMKQVVETGRITIEVVPEA